MPPRLSMNALLPAGIEAYLKEAGFSATEMLVLKKLVEEETLTVRELAAKTGKSTGVLDQSMKKLLQKGIAQKGTINGQPRYSIRSLESLVQWVKKDMQERQKMLVRKHENFEQYISSLKVDRKRPDMEHFTGEDGIKQAYLRLLETGKELLTVTPIRFKAEEDPLRVFHVELFRKRQARKIFQRVIAPDTPLARRFQSRDAFEYRKTILLPEADFPIEFERTIAGDTLLCINHADQTACLLKYEELVHVERAAFEALWAKNSASSAVGIQQEVVTTPISIKTKLLSSFREFLLSKKSLVTMVIFAIIAGVITFGLYASNRQANLERMRDAVIAIASTGALQFDARDINQIHGEEDISKPEYAKLVAKLNLIRCSNPDIQYAYLMRKTEDPNTLNFIADADSLRPSDKKDLNNDGVLDAADALSYPGDDYDISAFPEMLSAFDGPYADKQAQEDQWGSFISGAAPVRDSSGNTVAIVGIDMLSTRLDQLSSQTFTPLYFFFLLFFSYLAIRYFALNRSLMKECGKAILRNKVSVFVSLVLITIFILIVTYSSRIYIRKLIFNQTGYRLVAITSTAADDFDANDLNKLRFAKDMQSDVYQRVFQKLNEIRNKNPEIKFAYILRLSHETNIVDFVADADSNFNLPFYSISSLRDEEGEIESNEAVAPGVIYFDSSSNGGDYLANGFKRPVFGEIDDQWGKAISACAPIDDDFPNIDFSLCIDNSSIFQTTSLTDLKSEEIFEFLTHIPRSMWIVFALLAPFFFAIVHVLDKFCVEEVLEEPWMGVVTSAASSIVAYIALPIFFPFIDFSHASAHWILIGISVGIFIQASQFFYFKALSFSQAGIVAAYWNLIPAFLPIASYLLFKDVLEFGQYMGILILIVSSTIMCLLDYHFETRNKTFALMVIAALMQVIAYLIMSQLYANQNFIIAFYSVITGIILTGLFPLFFKKTRIAFSSSMHRIRPQILFFILIEVANILALASAQMAIKLGDASLVAAVETTVPAFTFLLSIIWLRSLKASGDALWNNFVSKMGIVAIMIVGVWLVS